MFKHRRGKVNLTYITNDSRRRATFKKRSKGLLKKVSELTTLCDVKACAIVYNPEEDKPIHYPDDPFGVLDVVNHFSNLSVTEQEKKMFDQEDYLKERITKTNQQLFRLKLGNREKKLTQLMNEFLVDKTKTFDTLSTDDLQELDKMLDLHLKEIEQHIDTLLEDTIPYSLPSPPRLPLIPVGPNQILAGLEEMAVINPSIVGPRGHVVPKDFGNNKNMETYSTPLDNWFIEMQRNSQEVGGSSSNSMLLVGSEPNLGA